MVPTDHRPQTSWEGRDLPVCWRPGRAEARGPGTLAGVCGMSRCFRRSREERPWGGGHTWILQEPRGGTVHPADRKAGGPGDQEQGGGTPSQTGLGGQSSNQEMRRGDPAMGGPGSDSAEGARGRTQGLAAKSTGEALGGPSNWPADSGRCQRDSACPPGIMWVTLPDPVKVRGTQRGNEA